MRQRFDAKTAILPRPQQEIWPQLAPTADLGLVLYGGTAVALHLGHRTSIDFDFFAAGLLDKKRLNASFPFLQSAKVLQEDPGTLVAVAAIPSGPVKVSFFGGMNIGRINAPLQTSDSTLLVASLEDLLATKLKAILDRAEAKDYRDIATMIAAGVSLERSLGGFGSMFGKDPALPLRALGFFKDGDLPTLSKSEQALLRNARDRVREIPKIAVTRGSLAGS